MRPLVLLREAAATAWASKVPSALVSLLVAVMVATTLATVGRSAAAEEQLNARMDQAGSRLLVVRDAQGKALIGPSIVEQASGLSVAERVIGTLAAIDLVNGVVGSGGARVPAWGIVGDFADAVTLTAGRWPNPGEALVSTTAQQQLGMIEPYGWVTEPTSNGGEYAVVGAFQAREPFGDYDAGVLYHPGAVDTDTLSVITRSPHQAAAAQALVLALIAPSRIEDVQLTSPIGVAELRNQVVGDLAGYNRTLLIGVLSAGGLLTAIVVLADVLVRRKDLGRRRALGANRATIVALVTARTTGPALLGAALGVAAGLVLTTRLNAVPPAGFVVAIAVLALLAAIASTIPPALYAATRDPVTVLRTP
ncbi:ABC transporter permease [Tessaracoccus caeni]|uniref:ABC transporter permease n=1 Tax=Tessaracoccus caeni TaxID=3031239 RepID=UPI0023D995CA|nr:FtsX-like permease family protein [Tessaracoccus caeni]MDF1486824.1 hypothetical protein [Tessaracoccus caeni]